jgi:hypothetical protein
MKVRNILFGAALIVVTATITTQVVSQDKGGQPPEMTPEQQAEMQKWMEFATPGPNHQLLQKKVGKWNGVVKHWMDPSAPPQEMSCTADIKAIFDGRYFTEEVEGEGMMPGQTFLGNSVVGYDNLKKKFIWVWIDNMGTGFMNAEGTYDAATKTFKYTYEYPEPASGKYLKGRSVDKWIDDNKIVSEMYGQDKTGKEIKMMEITFTRAK